MSNIPKDLKYVKSHEWVRIEGDGRVKIGITDFAQESLGDIVYIELPHAGDEFSQGENIAVVESVKATSDIYAPVGGRVVAVNDELEHHPELVNENSYDAWLVELADIAEDVDGKLLTPEAYEQVVQNETGGR